jgi:hypothetical protein
VNLALLVVLLFYRKLVLYDTFGTLGVLISVRSGTRVNDGRVLERWEWMGMQVKDTGWYNK